MKNYLGFTDNMLPMNKKRVEKILDKEFCYKGSGVIEGILSRKDFCLEIASLNGYSVEIEKDKRYSAKVSVHGRTISWEVTKLEHEFILYIEDKFNNNIEECVAYDIAETEKIEEEKRIAEEKRIEAERVAEEERKARKDFNDYAYNMIEKLTDREKQLCKETFESYGYELGNKADNVYVFICYLKEFDNRFAKECIIERLKNNANKATKKLFELYTGVKLVSGMKARIEQIDNMSSADFGEMRDFPKKRVRVNNKPTCYILIKTEDNKDEWREVKADVVEMLGMKFFIHKSVIKDCNRMCVYSLKSGTVIGDGVDKTEALQSAKFNLAKVGIANFKAKENEMLEKIEKTCGKNPLY